jgi:hypothetical protein
VSLRGIRSCRPGDQQPCAKTSKGLETERRPDREMEQVMTADEIIVGIDDSPSARGFSACQLRTPDRPEQRLAPFMLSTTGGTGHVRLSRSY